MITNDFYCTKCGQKGIPIIRRKGAEREAGHLKKLWCLNCNKEVNHVECKENSKYDYKDFIIEFEYGNFDTEGNRIRKYGELRRLIDNGSIEKQKTLDNVRGSSFGKIDLDKR